MNLSLVVSKYECSTTCLKCLWIINAQKGNGCKLFYIFEKAFIKLSVGQKITALSQWGLLLWVTIQVKKIMFVFTNMTNVFYMYHLVEMQECASTLYVVSKRAINIKQPWATIIAHTDSIQLATARYKYIMNMMNILFALIFKLNSKCVTSTKMGHPLLFV